MLIEELSDYSKELQETLELCVVHGSWRKKMKKSYLCLLRKTRKKKGTNEPQKFDLKPLPVELNYAYLEENY